MTSLVVGDLIAKAFVDAGIVARGQLPTPAQYSDGLDRINDLLSLFSTQGLKLWLQQDIACPLTAAKADYHFSPTGDVVMAKPLAVLQGYYLYSTGIHQPLTVLSRDEYARLSQTNVQGAINSYFTDKRTTELVVYVWNVPDATAATGTLHLIMRTSQAVPTITADTVGVPPEWAIALRWALADDLATGQPKEVQDRCAQRALAYREALEDFDVEDAPTFFVPDDRGQYGASGFM